MNKYSDDIMEAVRQNLGLEADDESRDDEINDMSRQEILECVCNWNGLINYADTIREWIENIWGIDLDDVADRHDEQYKKGLD